jgi:hypothetical protein
MSLSTNVTNLATRIATECKSLRTLVNGNASDLSTLTTTAKNNLVAAINELDAAIDALAGGGSATTLDDLTDVVITTAAVGNILRHNGTNWVNTPGVDHFQPLDSDLTSIAALTTTSYGRTFLTLANQAALMALIASASESASGVVELATSAETLTGTDTGRAVTPAGLQAKLDALLDGAPTALDTLNELAAAIGDDANFASTVTTALAGKQDLNANLTAFSGLTLIADRLPYANGSGTLALATITAAARSILDDASVADICTTLDIGSTTANYVTTFETGLT